MIDMIKQIAHMKAALWVNAFFYYFKRLWLVGRWMPDSIYANYRLKKILAVVAVVLRQVMDFFSKPLYLLVVVGIPFLSLLDQHPGLAGQEFAFLVHVLFFLSGLLGSLGDSQVFTVTREKVIYIKYLHTDARRYLQSFLAFKYVPFFLYYLPWLLGAARLLGASLWDGFAAWAMLFSFRMMGEAFQVWLFDRTGKVITRNMLYDWALILIGCTGAYLPALLGWNWPLAALLLHPAAVAVYGAAGLFCLWYITLGYRGYEKKFHRSLDLNFLLSTMLKSSGSAAFKEVEIKEKDAAVSRADQKRLRRLKGYSYLNALFFARHRRQLVKPVYYRLLMALLLFLGAAVLVFTDRETAVKVSGNLGALLPFFVYIMYFMTVADKASRAMFYNCDKDMLRYAYYRRPQTILRNFQIRLMRVSLYDIAIAGGVCLAAVGFCLLCGTSIFTLDMLLFCAAILLLSVLFTAHHLCLYYIFQPYSESLKIKNPFYSVINVAMYTLCFLCLQLEVGGLAFTLGVLGFTVLYIAGALALVYYRAPKSFRVK